MSAARSSFTAGSLTNLEAVHRWFYSWNTAKFNLYRGTESGNGSLIASWSGEDMDKAWEVLQVNLLDQTQNGGIFKLFVPSKAQNVGHNTLISLTANSGNGMAGIGAMGAAMPDGVSIGSYIANQVSTAVEAYKTEQRIAELEAQLDAASGPQGIVGQIQGFLERTLGQEGVQALAMAAIGAFLPKSNASHLAVHGAPAPIPEISKPTASQSTDTEGDAIEAALDTLEQAGMNLETDLPKLAAFYAANSEMARNLMSTI
jgi:hypothetical protein